jgi:hypothetical protein
MILAMSPRVPRTTQVGYRLPHEADTPDGSRVTATEPEDLRGSQAPVGPQGAPKPPAGPTPEGGTPTVANRAPPIEVEYIREADANMSTTNLVVLEVWTRNRIYHVDANFLCIAVINRSTGAPEENHSLKGARLTGGQRRSRTTMAIEIVVPLPVPGSEAVFKHAGRRGAQFGQTSTVERVVLKVRKVVVGAAGAEPAWAEVTGRFQIR